MNEGFVGYLKSKGKKMEELTIDEFMVKLFKDPDFYAKWLKEDAREEEGDRK